MFSMFQSSRALMWTCEFPYPEVNHMMVVIQWSLDLEIGTRTDGVARALAGCVCVCLWCVVFSALVLCTIQPFLLYPDACVSPGLCLQASGKKTSLFLTIQGHMTSPSGVCQQCCHGDSSLEDRNTARKGNVFVLVTVQNAMKRERERGEKRME